MYPTAGQGLPMIPLRIPILSGPKLYRRSLVRHAIASLVCSLSTYNRKLKYTQELQFQGRRSKWQNVIAFVKIFIIIIIMYNFVTKRGRRRARGRTKRWRPAPIYMFIVLLESNNSEAAAAILKGHTFRRAKFACAMREHDRYQILRKNI